MLFNQCVINNETPSFFQLNDYVGGLTEVHGQVDGQNNILCNNYIVFPKETSDSFSKFVIYYIWLSNYATVLWCWFLSPYMTWVRARACKLQKMIHLTCIHK